MSSVREFVDGGRVETMLLVREREIRTKKNGDEYLQLVLGDKTGTVPIKVWDDVGRVGGVATLGSVLHVRGRYTVHPKYGPEISLDAVGGLGRAEANEINWEGLLDGPVRPVGELEADMRALIATIQDGVLADLLVAVFDDETWRLFCLAPAAKQNHHGYRHGLLEHSLQVAQAVSLLATMVPEVARDVAVTGAILHDIGKLDVYTSDQLAIDYTTTGRLTGEIPLSYYRVRSALERVGLGGEGAAGVLHIIMSHHGSLEHGSPVAPCTREAMLVHFVDNLGARLGGFERVEKELPTGQSWAAYDRFLGGYAYFPNNLQPER